METKTRNNILIASGSLIVLILVIISLRATFSSKQGQNTQATSTDQSLASSTEATSTQTSWFKKTTSKSGVVSQNNSGNNIPGYNAEAVQKSIYNSTIKVPDTGIEATLVNGQADYQNFSVKGHITINSILGKVLTNDGYDVFVGMSVSKENLPTVNNYVVLYKVNGGVANYSSTLIIGDRLIPESVSAQPDPSFFYKKPLPYFDGSLGYLLNINYLGRRNGEVPTVSPTVNLVITAHVKNHIINR